MGGGSSSSSQAQNTTTTTSINDERVLVSDQGISATKGSSVTVNQTDAGALKAATDVANNAISQSAAQAILARNAAERERQAAQASLERVTTNSIDAIGEIAEDGFILSADTSERSFDLVDKAFDFQRATTVDAIDAISSAYDSASEGAGDFVQRFNSSLQQANATENERRFDQISSTGLALAAIVAAVMIFRG